MKEAGAEGGTPGRHGESSGRCSDGGHLWGLAGGWCLGGSPVGMSVVLVMNGLCPALGASRKFIELREHLGSMCFTACVLSIKQLT